MFRVVACGAGRINFLKFNLLFRYRSPYTTMASPAPLFRQRVLRQLKTLSDIARYSSAVVMASSDPAPGAYRRLDRPAQFSPVVAYRARGRRTAYVRALAIYREPFSPAFPG